MATRLRAGFGWACWLCVALGAPRVRAEPPEASAAPSAADAAETSDGSDWAFAGSLYTYFLPDEKDYVQPTLSTDWRWLHAEARYNYEAQRTASLWLGCNLGLGERVTFDLTMMAAAVFGDVVGFAPGLLAELNWWKLRLYVEAEYLIDARIPSDSYFYTWSELTLAPLEWLSFGLVLQRTRAYVMGTELQRGLLVGVTYKMLSLTGHLFDPFQEPVGVLALGAEF